MSLASFDPSLNFLILPTVGPDFFQQYSWTMDWAEGQDTELPPAPFFVSGASISSSLHWTNWKWEGFCEWIWLPSHSNFLAMTSCLKNSLEHQAAICLRTCWWIPKPISSSHKYSNLTCIQDSLLQQSRSPDVVYLFVPKVPFTDRRAFFFLDLSWFGGGTVAPCRSSNVRTPHISAWATEVVFTHPDVTRWYCHALQILSTTPSLNGWKTFPRSKM